jgi:hypothetical protein
MDQNEMTSHERFRVIGGCLSELFGFVDKIKVRSNLTEREVHWLLSQCLTSRIAIAGKEEGSMP